MAPDPDDVLEAALPVLVAWATWMPKPVDVSVTVEPPVVTVVVTTEVAVVEAVHPVQVVQGACVFHEPEVQPDQVLAGQPEMPHQLVQGPLVHAPPLMLAHGPHPLPGPPNGPCPLPALHPEWLPLDPHPHAPPGPQEGGVVIVIQLLATLLSADGKGCAEVMLLHSLVAVGQAVRDAAEVQDS